MSDRYRLARLADATDDEIDRRREVLTQERTRLARSRARVDSARTWTRRLRDAGRRSGQRLAVMGTWRAGAIAWHTRHDQATHTRLRTAERALARALETQRKHEIAVEQALTALRQAVAGARALARREKDARDIEAAQGHGRAHAQSDDVVNARDHDYDYEPP